jgi:hypothetical protein
MVTGQFCTKRVFKKAAFIGMAVLWGVILLVALAPIHSV